MVKTKASMRVAKSKFDDVEEHHQTHSSGQGDTNMALKGHTDIILWKKKHESRTLLSGYTKLLRTQLAFNKFKLDSLTPDKNHARTKHPERTKPKIVIHNLARLDSSSKAGMASMPEL